MLSVGEMLGIAAAILAAGGVLAKVAGLDARVNKLEAGQADQGRRIGSNESEILALKSTAQVDREYQRRLTGANPKGGE